MSSFSEGDGENRYFDASDELSSPSYSPSLDPSSDYCSEVYSRASDCFDWARPPRSVQERKNKFLDLLGLDTDGISGSRRKKIKDRIMMQKNGRKTSFDDTFSSGRNSFSSLSNLSNKPLDVTEDNGSINGRAEKENKLSNQNQLVSTSAAVQREVVKGGDCESVKKIERVKKTKWLSRIRSMTCIDKPKVVNSTLRRSTSACVRRGGARVQRVKVRFCKKRWKELSALYIGQDFQAHKGSISTMKFSLDGQYLATAGEDGVVRVWQVVEDIRSNATDIPEIDPSCMYFTMDHLSELSPYSREQGRNVNKQRDNLKKTADSTCVIFPPRVFRILEEPIHQFRGHSGEVLDLSWSKHNCLLSSSVDKTVRLWRVGFQQCLQVFPHSNYVTCIQFNPVDDNCFISGSIDGKIRIWEIRQGQVADWADVRDIITAVCYRPQGQGAIVGCIQGVCRFYDISDDRFQLEAQISLHNKKKPTCKRVTGFQFLPHDPSKVMVTCADAKVRIISGTNVVRKFKGDRCSGNQLFASFTADGKHIVSTSEDSNVYMWDYSDDGEDFSPSQPKVIKSWEKFSTDVSVAIPWCGLNPRKPGKDFQFRFLDRNSPTALPFSIPAYFSLGQEFILESFPRVSATWPEEKFLKRALSSPPVQKAQYKFLRSSCQSRSSCHAWDLVIVTAGRDGRIRSFHNYGLPVAV